MNKHRQDLLGLFFKFFMIGTLTMGISHFIKGTPVFPLIGISTASLFAILAFNKKQSKYCQF